MKLPMLYRDELQGFYKSKVMIFLWVGLPIVAILFRFVQVSTSGSRDFLHRYLFIDSFQFGRHTFSGNAYCLHH